MYAGGSRSQQLSAALISSQQPPSRLSWPRDVPTLPEQLFQDGILSIFDDFSPSALPISSQQAFRLPTLS